MAEKTHAMHGRDHRPKKYGAVAPAGDPASDPTEGMLFLPSASETDGQVLTRDSTAAQGIKWGTAAAGGYRNSTTKYAIFGPEFKTSGLYSASAATKTFDSASPFGGYIEYNAQSKYFVIGAPLGPKGSTWVVSMASQEGLDCGQVLFEWQTTLVDGVFSGFGFGAGPFVESVEGPETNGTTWYKDNSATTVHEDLYGAASDIYQTFYSPIRIGGTGSAMLSAHGTAVSDSPWAGARTQREMNGGGDGSVMWWLRVSNPSKNASSSAYRMRIFYIAIRRVENTTGFVLL